MPDEFSGGSYAPLGGYSPAQPSPFGLLFGQPGGLMPAMFGQQNMADRMRQQQIQAWNTEVMRQLMDQDRAGFAKTLSGGMSLMGMSAKQQESVLGVASQISPSTLYGIAAFGEGVWGSGPSNFLRTLAGGERGGMAHFGPSVVGANRYRIDPVTGRLGYSIDSNVAFAKSMYGALVTDDAGFSAMRGMRAEDSAAMFGELTMRGMMPGSLSPVESARGALGRMNPARVAALTGGNTDPSSMSASQLAQLTSLPEMRTEMRNFESGRAQQQLQRYAGAVAAVKEMFSDSGQPNAPMSQIFETLEQLTQGGVSKFDPQRLEVMVRTMKNLAKSAGLSVQAMTMMTEHASQIGAAMGLDPSLSAVSTSGAASIYGAMIQSGRLTTPMWGASSAQGLAQQELNMRQAGMASQFGNQAAVLMRLSESVQFSGQAAHMVEQLRRGGSIENLSQDAFTQMLVRDSGGQVDATSVNMMYRQRRLNQEQFVKNPGMLDSISAAQREEGIRAGIGLDLAYGLRRLGHGGPGGQKLGRELGEFIVTGMTDTVRADEGLRTKAIREYLATKGVNVTDAQAATLYGEADKGAQAAGSSLADFARRNDPDVRARGVVQHKEAAIQSALQSLSSSHRGTWFESLVGALQNPELTNKGRDGLMAAIGQALGGPGANPEAMRKIQAAIKGLDDRHARAENEVLAKKKELAGLNLSDPRQAKRAKEIETEIIDIRTGEQKAISDMKATFEDSLPENVRKKLEEKYGSKDSKMELEGELKINIGEIATLIAKFLGVGTTPKTPTQATP